MQFKVLFLINIFSKDEKSWVKIAAVAVRRRHTDDDGRMPQKRRAIHPRSRPCSSTVSRPSRLTWAASAGSSWAVSHETWSGSASSVWAAVVHNCQLTQHRSTGSSNSSSASRATCAAAQQRSARLRLLTRAPFGYIS